MKKASVALFVLFFPLYIFSLGITPLAIPDEARYGEIPREMLASGDWVVPRLNGLKYFEKPVLGYWMNAISMNVFGQNAFALRLPSALSVGFSALMIFMLVRRFSDREPAFILAPAIFLSCPLVLAVGHITILDSLLSMLLAGALICFFFAHMAENKGRKNLFLAFMGVFCGLAFLTKGFLAFALPVLVVVPFMIWEGRFKDLLKIPWIPILTAFLVALPWCVMIHFREGDFWNYFFWTEHIARFLNPISGQHPKPFWYFLPVLIGGGMPWVIQGLAAISMVLKFEIKKPLIRFALCWFFFPFLFFSVCSGKLIPYILPCFPPLAIILSIGLVAYFEAGKKRAFSFTAWVLAFLAGFGCLFFLVSGIGSYETIKVYNGGEGIKWLLASLGFFSWMIFLIWSTKAKDFKKKLLLYGGGFLVFISIVSFSIPNKAMDRRAPGKLFERNSTRVTPDAILVSNDNVVHAACWFFKRDDVKLLERSGELTYGLRHDDSKSRKLLGVDALKKMIQDNVGKRPVILALLKKHYLGYKDRLPPPVYEDTDNGFVFSVY